MAETSFGLRGRPSNQTIARRQKREGRMGAIKIQRLKMREGNHSCTGQSGVYQRRPDLLGLREMGHEEGAE